MSNYEVLLRTKIFFVKGKAYKYKEIVKLTKIPIILNLN